MKKLIILSGLIVFSLNSCFIVGMGRHVVSEAKNTDWSKWWWNDNYPPKSKRIETCDKKRNCTIHYEYE